MLLIIVDQHKALCLDMDIKNREGSIASSALWKASIHVNEENNHLWMTDPAAAQTRKGPKPEARDKGKISWSW